MTAVTGVSNNHHHVAVQKKTVSTDPANFPNIGALLGAASHGENQQGDPKGVANSEQRDERINEAFAKMSIQLQGAGSSEGSSPFDASSKGMANSKSAKEQFMDYMNLTPEEKVRAGMLADMGMTKEEYDALPPEKKAKIDKQIDEMERQREEQRVAKLKAPEPAMSSSVSSVAVNEIERTQHQQEYAARKNDDSPL
jgi:hypothetical protein